MHLIVITSVIQPTNAPTVFSTEERFHQLLDTIKSVRSKIPDCLVVVIEGSSYTDYQVKAVMEIGAHMIVHINVDVYDKQSGESSLLKTFFGSDVFSDLRKKHDILSIAKLSGRYSLTDDFVFHYDGETCICKISEPETSYSGHGFLYTRYYSLPIKYLDNYLQGLDKCCHNGIFINIEHSFYLYQALPLDKINRDRQKINVGGRIAPNGEYVED
jgi:hypothetical protein